MVTSVLLAILAASPIQKGPPVKAFILSGQSNMVGFGFYAAAPERKEGRGSLEATIKGGKYKHLLDKQGNWRVRDDVWIQFFDRKGMLSVGFGDNKDFIGPEFGFGHVVGDALREPVLLIKIAWGGKSLGADFRPPSSGGTVGPFYTELIKLSRDAIADVGKNFPELKERKVELAGFGWHQGWNDRINGDFVAEYESNMANFIRDVRKELNAPNLPFVIAETGMGGAEEKNERALNLMKAQAAVAQHPEFKDNVAFVGTREFWRQAEESPSTQVHHWNNNGETYFLIGDGMGKAMVNLLKMRRK